MSVPLKALTVRYALDQSNRGPLVPVAGIDASHIYLGNPVFIQVCLFNGLPSQATFVDDFVGVLSANLIIRSVDEQGELLVQKFISAVVASPPEFAPAATYDGWIAGTEQHFQFSLAPIDTNVAVPSCGRLQFYGGIAVTYSAGPAFVGQFNGYFIDDGTAVWIIGVTTAGAPVLYYRLVDTYLGPVNSLESINGQLLANDSVVKVIINGSNSEWVVHKPATAGTNLAAGIVQTADKAVTLERTEGY